MRLVQSISFGSRIAEDEFNDLGAYFVRTETWRKVRSGEVDVVLAPKGSGKSAIYSMLVSSEDELFDENILIAAGENPTGAPAFASLQEETPTEGELIKIWKLYFLVLLSEELSDYGIETEQSKELFKHLRDADLLPEKRPKTTLLTMVRDYISRLFNARAAGATVQVDPTTGMVTGFEGRIEFGEPTLADAKRGFVSIDHLYRLAEGSLTEAGYRFWLVLDRLDVAFASSPELERNALRALFRVYRDFAALPCISLKIFLRSDIWEAIIDDGFREASHINDAEIKWDTETLRQLVVRRLSQSDELCKHYGVDAAKVLATATEQERFFYLIFPAQVDAGSGKTATFDWCLSRTRDGKGITAPRELIHLMSEARDAQIDRYVTGQAQPNDPALFHPRSLDAALPSVSKTRLVRTIYAEFSDIKQYLEMLRGKKTEQNAQSLAREWKLDEAQAKVIAERLVDIGIFEKRSNYWVPFMYRPALGLVQGAAEGVREKN